MASFSGPGASVPTARLERFRWRTVLSAIGLTVAAYLLIGELSGADILGTLSHANPGWFAVAVIGSAVTYLAAAENLAAFVPKRLPLIRGFGVQLSTAFIGVAMPPTVGHVAVNARYLHRQDVEEGSIAAAVTMSQVVNVVTTVLLLIVFGLLTGSGLSRFKIAPGADVLIGLAVIAAIIIILVSVPQTRARLTGIVWPRLRSVGPRLLDAISQPLRLALSVSANLLLTAAYLVAFIAALRAIGAHPAMLPGRRRLPGGQAGGIGRADARRDRRRRSRARSRADGHRGSRARGDPGGAAFPRRDLLAAGSRRLGCPAAAPARRPLAVMRLRPLRCRCW